MKKFRSVLALLLALSVMLSCLGMASAAVVTDIAEAEEAQPTALNLGALSKEFKESNTHKYADTDIVRAIVILESAPEADIEGTPAEKSAYRLRLNKEHAAVRKAMTMPFEPAFEFTTLLNGFSCDVAYGELENIAKIDGVSAVYIANHYAEPVLEKPQNNYANQMIGNAVMNQNGYTGQGIVVAVLDTGLHTTHEAFKVYSGMPLTSTLTSSAVNKVSVNAKYLSQKVPFAYDYADKDNNVADNNGHGTHVAGTAVGYSASSDGGVIMSGGAPAAQLVAMKIFQDAGGGTSSDIYFSALEDAYTLGVDVVNMSIGAQNGFTYDSSLESSVFGNIYKRMEQAGIVMCVAAGNEFSMAQFSSVGFIGTDYTDYGTIASPAAYEGNISIAAVQNSHYPDYALTFNGKSFLFIDSCQDNTHGWLQTFSGTSKSVVVLKNADGSDLAIGAEADYASVNVRNKIVVVSRGEISFQEKMDFAANAGAIGIIVVNNEEGRISMSIDPFAIPAISVDISMREAFLTASSSATLSTPSGKSYVENPEAYQMCSFSNWGTSPMLTIDPTISSIGGNVYSAVPTGNSAYEVMSGTSMACPSAAGTFACLLEAIRETGIAGNTSGGSRKSMTKLQSLEKAVALMASTGIILSDAEDYIYSVRKQGGGLANSANSSNVFNNGAYITNPIQELGDDKNKTGVYTMSLKLVNDGYETVTYDQFNAYILYDKIGQVSDTIYSNTLSSGHMYAGTQGNATVTYKVNGSTVSSITLKPTETKTVTVTITLNAEAKNYYDTYFPNGTYVEGFVSLGNANMETHATFLAFYGNWNQAPALENLSTFHMLQANYALNNEIYADGQTWAEAGATTADVLLSKFGPFYTNMNQIYVINSSGTAVNYLGGNPIDVGNENTVYRPEYNAISANSSSGNAAGFMVYPFLLRNARYIRMTVKDKNTGTIYLQDTGDYIPKGRYDSENSQWSPHISFDWKGTKSANSTSYVASGTVVTVSFDIMLPYGESSNTWQTNALTFDCTVDSTAPTITSAIYDSSKKLVSVTASDSQYLAAIALVSSDGQTIHASQTFSPTKKGESCTAVFDVSGLASNNIVPVVLDYASNQASKSLTSGTVTGEPTEPTEPTQPTEPSQPTEPTEPTTAPTEPTEPDEGGTVDNYTYTLVTSASNLTAGDYILITVADGNYYALSTTQDGTYSVMQSIQVGLSSVASRISCDSASASAFEFKLAGNAGGLTLSTDQGGLYAYSGSDGVGLYYDNASTWTGSYNSSSKGFTLKSGSLYLALRNDISTTGENGYPLFAVSTSTSTGTTLMHMYKKDAPAECTHANTTTTTTDATCTTAGKTVVTCDDCGKVISTTTIPALGHNFKYASNNNGTHKVTCSRCDYSATENCDLSNGTCPNCGYTETPDLPDVPVEELEDGRYVIAAYVDGVYYAMSNTFASKINGTPITVTNGKVAADDAEGYVVTLTATDGNWTIESADGSFLKYSSGTSLGKSTSAYNWTITAGVNGSWRITSATSTGRGLIFRAKTYNQFGGYATSNCTAGSAEYFDVELLPVDGDVAPELPCTHENTTTTTTDATCTTAGRTVVTCDDCGEVLSTQVTPALGHNFKYSSNNNGTHKVTCSRCDYSATENCDLSNDTCPDCGYTEAPELPEEPEVPAGELTEGRYVIAAKIDGVYYAMSNLFASKIDGTEITVTGGKVAAADAEGYVIVLDSVDGGWTISDGNGNYLKYNSSTNLANTTDAYVWNITEGINGSWRVASTATTTRGLVYRAGSTNKFGGYALTNVTANSTEYYDVEFLPVGEGAAPETFSVKINHSLNLASDISINYAVATSALSGYSNYYLECKVPTYEGNTKTGTEIITIQPVVNGSYYYFTMDGLTAVRMNDVIEATLYASKGGKTYASEVDSYSIGIYAYNQLAKATAGTELKTLCAELLRYGAKAQVYKAYRTNALVDASMTAAHKAMLTDLNSVEFGNTNTTLNDLSNATVTWAGKALILDSKVTLRLIADLSKYSGSISDLSVRVTYKNLEGQTVTETLTDATVYNASKNYYAFDFAGLRAAELRTVVSAAVYAGNKQVSATTQYSMDTYGNNKTGDLLILCQSLMAYSDAALAYFMQ